MKYKFLFYIACFVAGIFLSQWIFPPADDEELKLAKEEVQLLRTDLEIAQQETDSVTEELDSIKTTTDSIIAAANDKIAELQEKLNKSIEGVVVAEGHVDDLVAQVRPELREPLRSALEDERTQNRSIRETLQVQILQEQVIKQQLRNRIAAQDTALSVWQTRAFAAESVIESQDRQIQLLEYKLKTKRGQGFSLMELLPEGKLRKIGTTSGCLLLGVGATQVTSDVVVGGSVGAGCLAGTFIL